jgi:hypothetical protein
MNILKPSAKQAPRHAAPRRAFVDDTHEDHHQQHTPGPRRLRMEHKKPERTLKERVKKPLAVLALAGVTTLGVIGISKVGGGSSPEQSHVAVSAEKPAASPSVVEVPLLSQSNTINEADQPKEDESYLESADYCQVIDVPFPTEYDYEEAALGSQTEFALSTEQYQKITEALDKADSREDAQKIVEKVFDGLGIKAKFDSTLRDDMRRPDEEITQSSGDKLDAYKSGLTSHMRGLAVMPKEMLEPAKSINFINESGLQIVEDGKINKNIVAFGYISWDNTEIGLTVRDAMDETIVHEFAHVIHQKVCENYSDSELEAAYNEALEILYSDPHSAKLEHKFSGKLDGSGKDWDHFVEQGQEVGFPNPYSREHYTELFAVLTADIILKGGLIDGMESESARRIKDKVFDRLTEAMPGTNVKAWLEYSSLYGNLPSYSMDPKDVIDKKISPYDFTYSEFKEQEDVEKKQAVELRMPNSISHYLYAAHTTTGGKDVVISYYTTSDMTGETRDKILKAAKDYVQPFAEEAGFSVGVIDGPGVDRGTEFFKVSFDRSGAAQEGEAAAEAVGAGGVTE